MTSESDFIAGLRAIATDPAARGLLDDAAVLEIGGTNLVVTHDMIVEGVHFLPSDPPGDVAWKLVAVNLSDLAAKGARPVGALLGFSLAGEDEWDRAFTEGLRQVLTGFGIALLGGDTVSLPKDAPRVLGLTAVGTAERAPSRAGARPGDQLWLSGSIGDAGGGLRILKGEYGAAALVERYRQPRPRLELGIALAPLVGAMMDVSDGLLIDASRIADVSDLALRIELGDVPLSAAFMEMLGEGRDARLFAATAGDDYELLFAADKGRAAELLALAEDIGIPLSRVGSFERGNGIRLFDGEQEVPLPERLGYEHRS
jgi:thiamine-monophosphate kinase